MLSQPTYTLSLLLGYLIHLPQRENKNLQWQVVRKPIVTTGGKKMQEERMDWGMCGEETATH